MAVYDSPASAPYVEEIPPAPAREYIESLSVRVFELARERGGDIPYTVVREVSENLIHAQFREPVISILDGGRTIRFSDQGPGFRDKERALQPGFTTATSCMKTVIRGVGSGLPIVSEFLSVTGGSLSIEDNLSSGSVVTITSCDSPLVPEMAACARDDRVSVTIHTQTVLPELPRLNTRQKQVLALVMESGSAGPSIVSRELGVGLSTAYRDLASLEEFGLISSEGGKRTLTLEGNAYLDEILSSGD